MFNLGKMFSKQISSIKVYEFTKLFKSMRSSKHVLDSVVQDCTKQLHTMRKYSNDTKPENNIKTFRFSDYDCIGFDLDNTVARYKIGAMMEMEYEILAQSMVEKGYSKKHLLKPVEHDFLLKGLIVDNENGNILKIAADGTILVATHGTKLLSKTEIQMYYPNSHWEATDLFAKDPLHTWNGPYSEKMRTLLDYFDVIASLVYARAVDSIDEECGSPQADYKVWPDLLEILKQMFNRDHFQHGKGLFFSKMKSTPEKYYYKCSEALTNWLKYLKLEKKLLFLITGAYVDFASLTASTTLGEDWRDYFDIIVTYAKKPGFFTQNREFMGLDGFKETVPVKYDQLQRGGIYTHGNWNDLHIFLSKLSEKKNPSFVYVGDNLIQDIYTPSVYSHCDTVAICEELEAEGINGYNMFHPDEDILKSSIWGSYFQYKDCGTNWYQILKDHSKCCIPSLEHIAQFPVQHEHQSWF